LEEGVLRLSKLNVSETEVAGAGVAGIEGGGDVDDGDSSSMMLPTTKVRTQASYEVMRSSSK
jgi:hypothetical protein